jgi:GNAT superfamily N-acetyltransferase
MATLPAPNLAIRSLTVADLDAVEAIDRVHAGHSRRHFFEKRLAAATNHPGDYVHVGAAIDGQLKGFAVARVLRGEHGQRNAAAVIDAVSVDRDSVGRGIGRALVKELVKLAQDRGIGSLQSQAAWEDFELLRFFRASGFELAPRLALERAVSDLSERPEEEE